MKTQMKTHEKRMQQILCPVDLATGSRQALRYAIGLGRAFEARVIVCHCLNPLDYHEEEKREAVVAQLSTMVNELISESEAPTIEWEVVAIEGDPTVDLVFEANARRVDLIVLSSRRRPLGAAFFGSTAESICRDALSPVLVLHEDARNWEGVQWGELPVRRILAAQDFSPAGDAALAYAAMLAGEYQTELQVLHVIPENYPETPSGVEFIEQQLDEMVPSEAKLWCSVKPVVRMGTPAAEILAQANQGTTDLLCLGRHRGDGEWREIFGSNTDFVLRHAPCPVLVAPPTTYSVSATD